MKGKIVTKLLMCSYLVCTIFFGYTPHTHAQQTTLPDLTIQTYSPTSANTDPKIPKNIFISNISNSNFTVNWTTDTPTTGAVVYAANTPTLTKKSLDKRDTLTEQKKRYTHYVEIIDSEIGQGDTVFFRIAYDDLELSYNSTNFEFKLPAALSSPPTPEAQDGTIKADFSYNQTNRDFLVMAKRGGNSTWISTVPQASLNWSMPIGGILDSTLQKYATGSNLTISAFGEQNTNSTSTTATIQDTPITLQMSTPIINPSPTVTPMASVTTTTTPTPTTTQITSTPSPTATVVAKLPTTALSDDLVFLAPAFFTITGAILLYIRFSKDPAAQL